MVRGSKHIDKLNGYWRKRLQCENDTVDRILQMGLLPADCDRSPVELVAACSLMIAKNPIHEVLHSIDFYSNECGAPGFDEIFFRSSKSPFVTLSLQDCGHMPESYAR
jgi:hypothetical protein